MATTYLLDDATMYLAANIGGLTFGTNLFGGLLPDTPDTAVACFEYSGEAPIYVMGPQTLPAISQPNLHVVCRDVSYVTARAQAEGCARALEQIVNMTVNTTYYLRVARLQDPFFMHRDAVKNRVYFACNFEVMREPS